MADYEIEELAGFEWMQSRIPALDALVHFIPDGPRDAAVDSFRREPPQQVVSPPGGNPSRRFDGERTRGRRDDMEGRERRMGS